MRTLNAENIPNLRQVFHEHPHLSPVLEKKFGTSPVPLMLVPETKLRLLHEIDEDDVEKIPVALQQAGLPQRGDHQPAVWFTAELFGSVERAPLPALHINADRMIGSISHKLESVKLLLLFEVAAPELKRVSDLTGKTREELRQIASDHIGMPEKYTLKTLLDALEARLGGWKQRLKQVSSA